MVILTTLKFWQVFFKDYALRISTGAYSELGLTHVKSRNAWYLAEYPSDVGYADNLAF